MNDSITPIITIHNLTKTYSFLNQPALNDISLTIYKGEFFGLLGPNGAGKTSLISILCGILKPQQGEITILDHEMTYHPGSIKKYIGLVTQDIALYEELTAWENFTLFGRLYGLGGKKLKERIEECLEITGLKEWAKRRVSTFSGGMKRLTNLVIGMLHEPTLLILDEPTVGIDTQSRHRIFEILTSINKTGVSLIYTTHYLEEAEQLCSRIAIIDRGIILDQGSPQELLSRDSGWENLEQLFLHLTGRKIRA